MSVEDISKDQNQASDAVMGMMQDIIDDANEERRRSPGIKRAVFHALTRLRAATTKESDTMERLVTKATEEDRSRSPCQRTSS